MNNGPRTKFGLTLVEILVVVAVIVLLSAMVIGISSRIDNQAKEKLTNSTIAILSAALEQFHDYGYNYPSPYSEFDFPLDCNGFTVADLKTTLSAALGVATVDITYHDEMLNPKYLEYSGCEVMYFFLSRIPECRQILDKIDGSLVTNINDDKQKIEISVDNPLGKEPLLRVVDPWGTTLHYDYYNEEVNPPNPAEARTFPVIISAGPDKEFWTTDDISNR